MVSLNILFLNSLTRYNNIITYSYCRSRNLIRCKSTVSIHKSRNMDTSADELPVIKQEVTDCIEDICDYSKTDFKQEELEIKIENVEQSSFKGVCKCYMCGEAYSSWKNNKPCLSEEPFICNLCQCKIVDTGSVTIHMKTECKEKFYVCFICKYKTLEKFTFDKHMKCHTEVNRYSCTDCEYKTVYKSDFVRHMVCHTREKPFSCAQCEFKTAREYSLVKHMRTHAGEKRFSCCICDHGATNYVTLIKHMKSHKRNGRYAR